jgi:hypothetical protein
MVDSTPSAASRRLLVSTRTLAPASCRSGTSVPSGVPVTIRGAAAVARGARASSGRSRYGRVALVDGTPGIVMAPRGRLILVLALTIPDGKIPRIDVIADHARLEELDLAVLDD